MLGLETVASGWREARPDTGSWRPAEKAFARRRVVLASGRESDFFIDCKQAVLTAEGHALVGEVMLDALAALASATLIVAVAGVELGGCSLASAVALTSFQRGAPLDAIYVRKDAKDHGSRRLLEGNAHLAPGSSVALLEDVVTTGGSTLKAAAKLREGGIAWQGSSRWWTGWRGVGKRSKVRAPRSRRRSGSSASTRVTTSWGDAPRKMGATGSRCACSVVLP